MKRLRLRIGVLLGLVLLVVGPRAELSAAPEAELWERWTAHDPASTATIDHGRWNALIDTYLVPSPDGINRFAYGRVSRNDKRALGTYIADLAALPIDAYNRDEQFAYWVNLYNALTVNVVLDHYPVTSILKISISPGLLSVGPWGKKLVLVAGEELSLDDIEHRILRPIWQDARIHYAVNCAALGCPNLMPVAFTGANANRLLDRGARGYVNRPNGIAVRGGGLVVSSIYDWYKDDFGGDDAIVIAHLRKYADPLLAEVLDTATQIVDDQYDWAINEADAPKQASRTVRGSSSRN